jgi:hypothetical protein
MVHGVLYWARLLRVVFVLVWYCVGIDRSDTMLLFMTVAEVMSKSLVGAMDGVKSIRFASLDYDLCLIYPTLETGWVMCQLLRQCCITQNVSIGSHHVGRFLV